MLRQRRHQRGQLTQLVVQRFVKVEQFSPTPSIFRQPTVLQ
ncbi:hypothetical protein [Klebsiella pneumoniae IS46]|nr:hypothetical protein [Klebsiella pneumoniae IS46]